MLQQNEVPVSGIFSRLLRLLGCTEFWCAGTIRAPQAFCGHATCLVQAPQVPSWKGWDASWIHPGVSGWVMPKGRHNLLMPMYLVGDFLEQTMAWVLR